MAEIKQRKWLLWSFLAALAASPLLFLFDHFGLHDNARAAYFFTLFLLVAIRIRWELRRHIWFWVAIVGIILLHLPLILSIHWAVWIPAFFIIPIAILDMVVIFAIIEGAAKLFGDSGQSVDEEPQI